MTTSLTAYTPLESLLLFQYLSSFGVEPAVFSKISDLLKSNPHIRDATQFDSGRLSPDALRDFHLRLLKEEARNEVVVANTADADLQNGDTPLNSRKRKAPSPSLPTVQEATTHSHLIPQLITKLYTRYRQHAIDAIREEERRYDRLQREISEIQRGEWDQRFQREIDRGDWNEYVRLRNGTNGKRLGPSERAEPAEADTSSKPTPNGDVKGITPGTTAPTLSSIPSQQNADAGGHIKPTLNRYNQTRIESVINHSPPESPKGQPATVQRPISASGQSHGTPSGQLPRGPNLTPSQPLHSTPRLPPIHPSNSDYRIPSPSGHQSPYAPSHAPLGPGPSRSPTMHNAGTPNQPPKSPVVLPPPPGMTFPPPVPGAPAYHSPLGAPQPYPTNNQRYSLAPLPGTGQHPPSVPPAPLQHARSHVPPYSGNQPMYPPPSPHQPPPMHYAPPPPGGYMLPPFQVTPPPPRAPPPQQAFQQPVPPINQAVANAGTRANASRPNAVADQRALAQSIANVLGSMKRPTKPPPLTIPISSTKWKQNSARQPANPTTPVFSPSPSPISEEPPPAPSVDADRADASTTEDLRPEKGATRTSRGTQNLDNSTRFPRDYQVLPNRRRRGSVASSAAPGSVQGRTRSQSVLSHPEDASIGNDSTMGRKVKHEPSTPADLPAQLAALLDDTSPTSAPLTRRRRGGTLQPVQSLPPAKNKRKRSARAISEASDATADPPLPIPSSPPQHVLASRNFPKMSVPVMNDITSHKHASLFSNPVKERDAEGYASMIRRPQNLKSIRAAIAAGARAVNAAATPAGTPLGTSSPGAAATTVVLPISEELVPPKGIVNSAQLERELMRMFANAVMFNSGEEGVVRDAREMFEAVQASVANWRSAERTGGGAGGAEGKGRRGDGEGGGEDGSVVEEEEAGGATKRRRVL